MRVTIARPDHAAHVIKRQCDQTAGPTRKQDPACFPKPPPGSVKGGSGKQDSEPETGVRRGRNKR